MENFFVYQFPIVPLIFAFLILFGKDPDDDFGIRLTGLVGAAICFIAFLTFYGYEENGLGNPDR